MENVNTLYVHDQNRYYVLSIEPPWSYFGSSKTAATTFAVHYRHASMDDFAPFVSMIEDKQLST